MDLAAAVAPHHVVRSLGDSLGSPTPLARQRTLPVADSFLTLFPEGGLARGRAIACHGVAATSLTMALTTAAAGAGAWLAVVDVPWLGVEAAGELGVPLERLVRVESSGAGSGSGSATAWADLVAAVLDGFELVVTRVPRRVGAGVARRVQSRVQARDGVLLVVGDPGPLGVDVALQASTSTWDGVGRGAGHLRRRRVTVVSSGRRIPRPRQIELWLPGPDGIVATVSRASPRASERGSSVGRTGEPATPVESAMITEPVLRSVG